MEGLGAHVMIVLPDTDSALEQWLLPASFDDGMLKRFRKAFEGNFVADGDIRFSLVLTRVVFGSMMLIDEVIKARDNQFSSFEVVHGLPRQRERCRPFGDAGRTRTAQPYSIEVGVLTGLL